MTQHILENAPDECECGKTDFDLIYNPGDVPNELRYSIPYVVRCNECDRQYSAIPF